MGTSPLQLRFGMVTAPPQSDPCVNKIGDFLRTQKLRDYSLKLSELSGHCRCFGFSCAPLLSQQFPRPFWIVGKAAVGIDFEKLDELLMRSDGKR